MLAQFMTANRIEFDTLLSSCNCGASDFTTRQDVATSHGQSLIFLVSAGLILRPVDRRRI